MSDSASQPGPPSSPPPPHGPGPSAHGAKRNGLGLAALILGVIAIVLSFVPFLSLLISVPLGSTGLVLGLVGLDRVRRGTADNRTSSIGGIVLSAIAIVLSIVISLTAGPLIGALISHLESVRDQTVSSAPAAFVPTGEQG